MKKENVRCSYIYVAMLLLLFFTSAISSAQTAVFEQDNKVVLKNELVKIEYDLAKGTYSAYSLKDRSSNIVGASLRINDYVSDAVGLTREWESAEVNDELGTGRKVIIKTSGKNNPDLTLELTLYNGKSFIVLSGGIKNTLGGIRIDNGTSIVVKEINPLQNASAFEGMSPKSDLRMLNGPGGAGLSHNTGRETRVHKISNMESPNNILATFINKETRKSIVVGGLTYNDYSKYATVKLIGKNTLSTEVFAWDPVGKRVDTAQTYLPNDKFYLDFCTENPFEALEQYGLSVRATQKVNLMIHDFPTLCGWYVAVFSKGGEERNNSAGMVSLMDGVKESGFLRYSKAAVRLVPDNYGENNEQGWWDDEHWQKLGHYVKPYETTQKWAKAVVERGGIPLTYSQTGANSHDFIDSHEDWFLFNDIRLLYDKNGKRSYKSTCDFTDPGFQEHLEKVYKNLRDGGVEGLMFDYPEGAFRFEGGFEDEYSTSAAAYRIIFEIPKRILGPKSYIDERNIWSRSAEVIKERGCFMDITAGLVDNQRVWSDTDIVTPEMLSRCGHRWDKNRVMFLYDMDAKDLTKALPNNSDGGRKLLSMVYLVAPRLVLANSFRKLSKEQIHDLTRIYPIHSTPKSSRPLDAFQREDGIPRVYDFEVDETWHQIAFYNPDNENSEVIDVDLAEDSSFGGMALNPKKSYYIYDFWNDAFLGVFSGKGKLEQTLRPGEVRVMSVHEIKNHPQFISSNRHIMQGYIDVSDVKWNLSQKVLSGNSKVVGGETYKLVIATNGYKTVSSAAQNAETEILKGENPNIVELAINRAENGTVDWSISF